MTGPVAVTGAGGMLGRELVRAAAARGVEVAAWDRAACDVTDGAAVARALADARPSALIHAAAFTRVDDCEADPARAFLVNARGTANVAGACRSAGVRMILLSTDYVFAGDADRPYAEDDAPGPLSVYGWSKLLAEEAVSALGEGGAIVRTAWLYADHGANFLRTMLQLGRERGEVRVVDDQHGSPTFAADLAGALLDLAAVPAAGVFHATNTGATTWYGFARRIFELARLPARLVPTTTEAFPRPARRPAWSVLGSRRLAEAGVGPLPPWEDALRRCLERAGGSVPHGEAI